MTNLNSNNNCNIIDETVNLFKKVQTQPQLSHNDTTTIVKGEFNEDTQIIPSATPTVLSGYLNTAARIDIRRSRSFRDLSQIKQQQVYCLDDLIFGVKIA